MRPTIVGMVPTDPFDPPVIVTNATDPTNYNCT